ncbi:hypothetical protein H3V53_03340 [Paraburkholderia bengalensis]|uniref:Core-binding (CB) domain-containing protein n=1 Tax=Paraburkholderia bengalensis TaxID=2747562 RepID=A0ABU8IL16_9BURK
MKYVGLQHTASPASSPFIYRGVPIRPIEFLDAKQPFSITSSDSLTSLNEAAAQDILATRRFLAQCESPGTARAYERELDRILLWAWAEAGKPLSALTTGDFSDYASFLADPQPRSIWCGSKTRRESVNWRPFEGALQDKARNTSVSVTTSLMRFLTEIGYVQHSTIPSSKQPASTGHAPSH